MIDYSQPKILASKEAQQCLMKKRYQLRVRSLNKWVDLIRKKKGDQYSIPYFDPNDGGVKASVLFLLEAPGRQARGSGFISRNNHDGTAANMLEFLSDFSRHQTVLWNVIP